MQWHNLISLACQIATKRIENKLRFLAERTFAALRFYGTGPFLCEGTNKCGRQQKECQFSNQKKNQQKQHSNSPSILKRLCVRICLCTPLRAHTVCMYSSKAVKELHNGDARLSEHLWTASTTTPHPNTSGPRWKNEMERYITLHTRTHTHIGELPWLKVDKLWKVRRIFLLFFVKLMAKKNFTKFAQKRGNNKWQLKDPSNLTKSNTLISTGGSELPYHTGCCTAGDNSFCCWFHNFHTLCVKVLLYVWLCSTFAEEMWTTWAKPVNGAQQSAKASPFVPQVLG